MVQENQHTGERRMPDLPPRAPSRIRRNYIHYFIQADEAIKQNEAAFDVPKIFTSWRQYLEAGIGTLPEKSNLYAPISRLSLEMVKWLDSWVDPQSVAIPIDRTKPMVGHVIGNKRLDLIKQQNKAHKKGEYFDTVSQMAQWWTNDLIFTRFLVGKGSMAQILFSHNTGFDSGKTIPGLVRKIGADNIMDMRINNMMVDLAQGADFDFAVFPADVYEQVFTEFFGQGVFSKILSPYKPKPVSDAKLQGDEKAKYELDIPVRTGDIDMPPGFILNSDKLCCAFLDGKVAQNIDLPYKAVEFTVNIKHQKTGEVTPFKVMSMEFMPSFIDETMITRDTRSAFYSLTLSELRGSGCFMCNKGKLYQPAYLTREMKRQLHRDGVDISLDNRASRTMMVSDRLIGDKFIGANLQRYIDGDTYYSSDEVADTVGRMIRSDIFNWINNFDSNDPEKLPIEESLLVAFQRAANERFNPSQVTKRIADSCQRNVLQSWLLDFPTTFLTLNKLGFGRFFKMAENSDIYMAVLNAAIQIQNDPEYQSFLKRTQTVKKRATSDKPGKFEDQELQAMVDMNLKKAVAILRGDRRIPLSWKEGKTDIELAAQLTQFNRYKILPSMDYWGGDIDITGVDKSSLTANLKSVAEKHDCPIFGYTYERDGRQYYHITRYPRPAKYKIPEPQTQKLIATEVAKLLPGENQGVIKENYDQLQYRVVLGFNAGYGAEKEQNTTAGKDFVVSYLIGQGYKVTEAKITTQSPGKSLYEEDVIVITADDKTYQLDDMVTVAELLDQERFTVEDLYKQRACLIETKNCQQPDSIKAY